MVQDMHQVLPIWMKSLGEHLRSRRVQLGLSQEAVAEVIGVTARTIQRWERDAAMPQEIYRERLRHLFETDSWSSSDISSLPEPRTLSTPFSPWTVPHPRNPFFTGREEILHVLHTSLGADQIVAQTPFYALQGLGGVGKTQVALEYAYRYASEYTAIFWIEAATSDQVLSSFQRMAEQLRVPVSAKADPQWLVKAVQDWLATHHKWLLIWDDLKDLDILRLVLPFVRQGAFLLTTRRQALGTLAHGINLPPMESGEGVLFLLRRAKVLSSGAVDEQRQQLATSMPAEYAAASELVTILGRLPLALDQVGAYLEETGSSFTTYLQYYKQQQISLLDRRGSSGTDHPQSVVATFLQAKEQAEREQMAAADLLRVCALLDTDVIPEGLFHAGAQHLGPVLSSIQNDPARFDLILTALRNVSLVQREPGLRILSLHNLVRVIVREQIDSAELHLWSRRVICMVNAVFPGGDLATWTQCEWYLAQALACISLVPLVGESLPEADELLSKIENYLSQRRSTLKEWASRDAYNGPEPCPPLDTLCTEKG